MFTLMFKLSSMFELPVLTKGAAGAAERSRGRGAGSVRGSAACLRAPPASLADSREQLGTKTGQVQNRCFGSTHSTSLVPVRCLRAVNSVESSQHAVQLYSCTALRARRAPGAREGDGRGLPADPFRFF
jgi:hypothetical protein